MKNITLFKVNLPKKEVLLPALEKVFESGYIAEGDKVVEFENKFGSFIGNKNVFSLNSGTAALHTSLLLADVKPGDYVISTPATSIATNQAILMTGAKIIWADIEPQTGNISPASIKEKIREGVKAIVAVHYGGIPVKLDDIAEIAQKNDVPLIEDAAHALGARYKGKMIGCHSDFVTFSFQAIKHITTVDGGMVACKKSSDVGKGKLIRWFGLDKSKDRAAVDSGLDVSLVGYKYHMNNVAAAIGILQLDTAGEFIRKHKENADFYNEKLKDIPGVKLCKIEEGVEPSWWLFTLRVENRNGFIKRLQENGIAASIVHQRNDIYSVFKEFKAELPGVDEFYKEMVHIPVGWWLSQEDLHYIVNVIKNGW